MGFLTGEKLSVKPPRHFNNQKKKFTVGHHGHANLNVFQITKFQSTEIYVKRGMRGQSPLRYFKNFNDHLIPVTHQVLITLSHKRTYAGIVNLFGTSIPILRIGWPNSIDPKSHFKEDCIRYYIFRYKIFSKRHEIHHIE